MAERLRCSKCKKRKSLESFRRAPGNSGRHQRASWCRVCANISTEKWRAKNPSYVKEKSLRYREAHKEEQRIRNKKYRESHPGLGTWYRIGVSFKEKMKRFAEQGKVCAICGCSSTKRKEGIKNFKNKTSWCADHDHQSGKFRGVLCWRCNWLLGHAEDSEKILKSAIAYLRKNN